MSTWSKRGKSSVPYVWTAKDDEYEHGAKPDGVTDPRVTTYRIKPGALPGAVDFKPGKEVAINLDDVPRMGEPWTINRFFPADEFDWEELTGDALTGTASCQTIGELCQKLFAINPRKYPDHYYNFEKAAPKAKHDVAAMLFEYWDNTAFRYAVTKDGFDWSVLSEKKQGAAGIAAAKGELRLRWVLVKRPTPIVRAVAPGQTVQNILAPPAVFGPLALHAREIEQATARARALLEQSGVYVKERTRLAHQTTALRVLVQTAASARVGDSTKAIALAGKAREVEQAIAEKARTAKLPELLGAQQGAPSPALAAVIRRELGYVDDIAAALTSCRDGLCGKLLDDGTSFARHIEDWLTWVIDKKQQLAQPVQAIYTRLAQAVAGAFGIFEELDVSDTYAAKITATLEATPAGAFTDPRQAGPTAMHKLGAVLGRDRPADIWPWLRIGSQGVLNTVVRGVVPSLPNLVGNLAGVPSLQVALMQFSKWREFQTKLSAAKHGWMSSAQMTEYIDGIMSYLDKHGSKVPPATKDAFRSAMNRPSQEDLAKVKREILDEYSGTFQASNGAKVGALLLQILAITIALNELTTKENVRLYDYGGFFTQLGQGVVGAADVAISVKNTARWPLAIDIPRLLPKFGMALGYVGAVFGMIAAGESFRDASSKSNRIGQGIAVASFAGNLATLAACSAWIAAVPVPGLNIAGIVLTFASTAAGIALEEHEKAKSRASKIAVSLVHQIRNSPFYASFSSDEGVRTALADLASAAEAGDIQKPPNNDFVRRALADAGFDLATIEEVVDHSNAPLFPGLMPQPG